MPTRDDLNDAHDYLSDALIALSRVVSDRMSDNSDEIVAIAELLTEAQTRLLHLSHGLTTRIKRPNFPDRS